MRYAIKVKNTHEGVLLLLLRQHYSMDVFLVLRSYKWYEIVHRTTYAPCWTEIFNSSRCSTNSEKLWFCSKIAKLNSTIVFFFLSGNNRKTKFSKTFPKETIIAKIHSTIFFWLELFAKTSPTKNSFLLDCEHRSRNLLKKQFINTIS